MLDNETVEIFLLKYDDKFDPYEDRFHNSFLKCFSKHRLEAIEKMRSKKAGIQAAAAELTVCAAMKSMGMPIHPVKYEYSETGAPVIEGGFISISHTDGLAGCAVSAIPIGFDIEVIRNVNLKIADRVLCREELVEFHSSEAKLNYLFSTWTAKESFLKLTGEGLSGGMKGFRFFEKQKKIKRLLTGDFGFVEQFDLIYDAAQELSIRMKNTAANEGCGYGKEHGVMSVSTQKKCKIKFNYFESICKILDEFEIN